MAGLAKTMEHARTKFADAPVPQRSTLRSPAAPPDSRSGTNDIDSDIVARLKRLDHDQVLQVAEALGRHVDGAGIEALRRSIADWVDEWASDVAEDRQDEEPEAARAAGRQEAIGSLEEEVFHALLDSDLPQAEWQEAMGVSEERLQELTGQAVEDGWLDEPLAPDNGSDR